MNVISGDPPSEMEFWKHELRARMEGEPAETPGRPLRTITGDIGGRPFRLEVFVSPRFLRTIRKERLVNQPVLYSALANLKYGYDPAKAASPGGKDGIFTVSRDFRPKNEMVAKLYDRFLDTERGAKKLRSHFGDLSQVQGVRVVCHGLRLLGFIQVTTGDKQLVEKLVLVDLDVNKR